MLDANRSESEIIVVQPGADASRFEPDARRGTLTDARRTEALLQTLLALDIDYRNGGSSPVLGFDCSGLVVHIYREAYGLQLPRSAREQSEIGRRVELHELMPGDLVFYNTLARPYSHVGIYIGDNRFVHAPKSGARVRIENVRSSYWASRFDGARRITSI